ncbi:MAG: type I phosphomannose isomerase catalytic subunit [Prevotella sp.]
MKPYKFKPILKPTIWGGDKIAPFKGMDTTQKNIGESWEISGVEGHESVTACRGLTDDHDIGMTLPQLIHKYKGRLTGERIYRQHGEKFPLLVKFIDSRQNLSVQVHPDDHLAMERHGCAGKTEMWYIIKADEGAKIYAGLNRPLSPSEYERLATAGLVGGHHPMLDVIATHESHQGDLYFLPAGRLHAIGAGNFLAEIQQTSDITYRVYDYGRKDSDGRQRELHIEQARDAIDYHVWPEYRSSYDSTLPDTKLVSCPYFDVRRVVVQKAARIEMPDDTFVIVVCLRGMADINGVSVRQGETLLVPACENTLRIFGNATFLTATM